MTDSLLLNGGTVALSPLRDNDVEEYVHLHIELLNVSYAHLFGPDFAVARRREFSERREELIADLTSWGSGQPGTRQHWIARSRLGTPVAVAGAGPGPAEWESYVLGDAWRAPCVNWCVDHLYIVPGLQGKGLAVEMMNVLMPEGEGFLWVFENNRRAVRFYERLGFVPDGLTAPSGPEWGDSLMNRMVKRR